MPDPLSEWFIKCSFKIFTFIHLVGTTNRCVYMSPLYLYRVWGSSSTFPHFTLNPFQLAQYYKATRRTFRRIQATLRTPITVRCPSFPPGQKRSLGLLDTDRDLMLHHFFFFFLLLGCTSLIVLTTQQRETANCELLHATKTAFWFNYSMPRIFHTAGIKQGYISLSFRGSPFTDEPYDPGTLKLKSLEIKHLTHSARVAQFADAHGAVEQWKNWLELVHKPSGQTNPDSLLIETQHLLI